MMVKKTSSTKTGGSPSRADNVIGRLKKMGKKQIVEGMARYAIPAENAVGVAVGELKAFGKKLGPDHELAEELWASGVYEARMLAAFIGEPARLSAKQMKAWIASFDSWAICDHVCFNLFDRSPLAWDLVPACAKAKGEFEKRTAFALIWSLSVHDKEAEDRAFLDCLPLIAQAAEDERNFVKKSVDMALRAVGKRNRALNAAALALAEDLADSDDATARWIGRKAAKELSSASVRARLA